MQTITEEQRAMRRRNSALDTVTVLSQLKSKIPDAWQLAEVVGQWVWIEFDSKPDQPTRDTLLDLGFHWNHTRKCWQHACGKWTPHTTGNPRWKYFTAPASTLNLEAAVQP